MSNVIIGLDNLPITKTYGWIGVDLDGTLAFYDKWEGPTVIGEPIPDMLERVKKFLARGYEVKIFTARVHPLDRLIKVGEPRFHYPTHVENLREDEAWLSVGAIRQWCKKYIGQELAITNVKDFHMRQLWDDRCVSVGTNLGVPTFSTVEDLLED